MILNYLKSLLYFLISITILTLIITIFNYFSILNGSIISISKLIIPIISILIGSIILGKNTSKKGYIEGLKLSIIIIIIIAIINFLFLKSNFEIKILLYYLIITITSMIGAMIGINLKRVQN